jgi:diguanylate cyclase (GGDEF)-like protein
MSCARLLGLLIVMFFAVPAGADEAPVVRLLSGPAGADAAAVVGGGLDSALGRYSLYAARRAGGPFWLRLDFAPAVDGAAGEVPVLVVRRGRHLAITAWVAGAAASATLPRATLRSDLRGTVEETFLLPADATGREALYVRVEPVGSGAEELEFGRSTLAATTASSLARARIVAGAFAALMAMSIAAVLIWFVLPDRLFLFYGTLFSLQGLYVAFLTGQGFDWPVLSLATPLLENAWNVSAALSGTAACLFVREIADLRRYSPRVYAVFGWLAVAFLVLAASNGLAVWGAGGLIADIGNVIFVGTAIFTLVVAFLAWRRGSRAAGWFLIAWALLEVMTIATAASFLLSDVEPERLYTALPLSMVAAAILVALGVADRVREQRVALGEAERRAQLDPLTGVLNRNSLLERLEAASQRAQARGLPISVLFIDLDHFKSINDSLGHLAGDACLRAVVAPIQAELRQSDVIGRYGGEEFVVLLSSADRAAARAIAERIRARVAELCVEGFSAPIHLTCSIGVAGSDVSGVWGEALLAEADAAVYAAKRSGRNQVQAAAQRALTLAQA